MAWPTYRGFEDRLFPRYVSARERLARIALEVTKLEKSGRKLEPVKLDQLLGEWDANENNNDEDFWQDVLKRNAWVFWEAETSRWLQFDPATNQWGPLR